MKTIKIMSNCHNYDGPDWQAEREPLAVTLKRTGVHSIAVDLEPFKAFFQNVAEINGLKVAAPPVIYPRFYYMNNGQLMNVARA